MYTGNDPAAPPTRQVTGNINAMPYLWDDPTNTSTPIALRDPSAMSSIFGGSFGGGGGSGTMDPYMSDLMGLRGTGGTGGGSEETEGNMDANDLISLSEFLGENVTSFAYGGKMKNPYQYGHGGKMSNMMNQLAALSQINKVAKAAYGMKMKKRYTQGGRF